MIALLSFLLAVLASPFRSNSSVFAENALLLHQVIVLRRKVKGRVLLTNGDRWFFVQLYRWFPSTLSVLAVIQPETLVRWHRPAFASTGAGSRGHSKADEFEFAIHHGRPQRDDCQAACRHHFAVKFHRTEQQHYPERTGIPVRLER